MNLQYKNIPIIHNKRRVVFFFTLLIRCFIYYLIRRIQNWIEINLLSIPVSSIYEKWILLSIRIFFFSVMKHDIILIHLFKYTWSSMQIMKILVATSGFYRYLFENTTQRKEIKFHLNYCTLKFIVIINCIHHSRLRLKMKQQKKKTQPNSFIDSTIR